MASSLQIRTGRYKQGGTTESSPGKLGWWERRVYPMSDDDTTFEITPTYIGRPDLIAYAAYGKASLMWLVLEYNNIVDINEELVGGASIKLPSAARVYSEILTKT